MSPVLVALLKRASAIGIEKDKAAAHHYHENLLPKLPCDSKHLHRRPLPCRPSAAPLRRELLPVLAYDRASSKQVHRSSSDWWDPLQSSCALP